MVVQTKICLYELLEVARDADDTEIKKAYRKQALRWHPDKNSDNVTEATSRFKQIQEAYDILKDPNERAWYDSHREQVLRGGSTEETEDDGIPDFDLAKWCTDKAFKDFSDQPKGFFTVYAQVFAELVALEEKGSSPDSLPRAMPEFGTKSMPLEKVETFYGFWAHFSSTRTFVHREKWRLSEAPSRQVKRIMERDNKKARESARKEYNDLIRELARWVKQKDPRMAALKRKQAEDAEQARISSAKAKAEQEEKKKGLRQELRAFEAARMEEQARERREKYGIEEEEEESPDEIEVFDCELCNKSFKSHKQWENHQQGNKHKQAVANFERSNRFECKTCSLKFPNMNALRKHEKTPEHVFAVEQAEMRKDRSESEEESSEGEEGESSSSSSSEESSEEDGSEEESAVTESTETSEEDDDNFVAPPRKVKPASEEEEDDEEEEEEEDLAESLKKLQVTGKNKPSNNEQADKGDTASKKLNKTQKRKLLRQQEAEKRKAESKPAPKKTSEPPVRVVVGKKGKGRKDSESEEESETASEEENENKGKKSEDEEEDKNEESGEGDSEEEEETKEKVKPPTKMEAKPKLTAKQAKKLKQQLKARGEGTWQAEGGALKCGTCKSEFPSRTKLFQHLESSKHALPPR